MSTDEDLGDGAVRSKPKRVKVAPPPAASDERDDGTPSPVLVSFRLDGEPELAPAPAAQTKKARRKTGDATYRPTAAAESESDEDESDGAKRRRKKGKGRASGGSSAIPIGRRDGEVWMNGRKRKGRKSARKSAGGDDEDEDESGGEQDLGGHDEPMFDDQDQDQDQDQASTSFFLRPKSPSPTAPQQPQSAESSPGQHHAPFSFSFKSLAGAPPAPADPAFASFDRSFRSESVDDSGLHGSSYDFSEEERIVKQLEQDKAAQAHDQAQKQQTPTGLRKRVRLPPPPAREPYLGDIEEEEESKGSLGRSVGVALRPLWTLARRVYVFLRNPLLDWARIFRAAALLFGSVFLLILFLCVLSCLPQQPAADPNHSSRPAAPAPTAAPSTPGGFTSYLPFLRPKPAYAPPDLPADSLTSLVSRLTTLEKAMGHLSSQSTSERTQTSHDRTTILRLADQVHGLESSLTRLTRGEDSSTKAVQDLQSVLEQLSSRVRTLAGEQRTDHEQLGTLANGVDQASRDIAALGQQVQGAERLALDAIERRLPAKLAVRFDERGQLEIDPTFWKHLQAAFVDKKDGQRAGPTWDGFLRENEAALRAWVGKDLEQRVGADAIVSRRSFLDVLHREIKSLKVDFEQKSNENVQQIGRELLDKVAKQDQLRRDALPPAPPAHTGSITLKGTDGKNISAIIASVVDSALLRYSKDVLARPDYAMYGPGGRIIPRLTSTTYSARPVGLKSNLVSFVTGQGATPGRPPVTALHPDNSPGSCWPFAGQQGQLGILLSRRVVPSDITLEHVSRDIAPDGDVSSAPKDFEVWAVVEGREHIERLADLRLQQEQARVVASAEGEELPDEGMTSLPPTPNHMLLVAGQYDVAAPDPVQTFPVQAAVRQLGIPVGVVVVRFLSNHGEQHYTCVYRVRVGGASEAVASS